MTKEIRISLLGHKDHGKSTLIGRLLQDTGSMTADRINEAKAISEGLGKEFELAFLLDSFVEEREGGFTLDTTVAQVRHGDCIYNMIDVPGHKELVRNMLSGASLADAAILIISAREDEGLQDETRLHIYLARMLGITRLLVAVNKMDSAGFSEKRFRDIRDALIIVLEGFGFDKTGLEFIPLSAKSGDNVMASSAKMPWYQGKPLIRLMEEFAGNDPDRELRALPARMFVQDTYDVGGSAVIVGKVECGSFASGDEITIGPGEIKARIEELHGSGGLRIDRAYPGQNVGIRLSGGHKVGRGRVCMGSRPIAPARKIRARIFCLPEAEIPAGEMLMVICAAQESPAKVSLVINKFHPIKEEAPKEVGAEAGIGPGEAAEAEIETQKEMLMERFSEVPPMGRFILSRGGKIAGVGIVI